MPVNDSLPPTGISRRDYIATAALQGLLGGSADEGYVIPVVAKKSVEYADALISALNAETPAPADVNADLIAALRHIGYEPIGHAEATHREVCDGMTEIARAALAKAGVA